MKLSLFFALASLSALAESAKCFLPSEINAGECPTICRYFGQDIVNSATSCDGFAQFSTFVSYCYACSAAFPDDFYLRSYMKVISDGLAACGQTHETVPICAEGETQTQPASLFIPEVPLEGCSVATHVSACRTYCMFAGIALSSYTCPDYTRDGPVSTNGYCGLAACTLCVAEYPFIGYIMGFDLWPEFTCFPAMPVNEPSSTIESTPVSSAPPEASSEPPTEPSAPGKCFLPSEINAGECPTICRYFGQDIVNSATSCDGFAQFSTFVSYCYACSAAFPDDFYLRSYMKVISDGLAACGQTHETVPICAEGQVQTQPASPFIPEVPLEGCSVATHVSACRTYCMFAGIALSSYTCPDYTRDGPVSTNGYCGLAACTLCVAEYPFIGYIMGFDLWPEFTCFPAMPVNEPSSAIESAVPTSAGEESAVPTSAGEESAIPTSAGEESAVTTSVGEESAVPTSAGEESAVTTFVGEESTVPTSVGEQSVVPTSVESAISESSAAPQLESSAEVSAAPSATSFAVHSEEASGESAPASSAELSTASSAVPSVESSPESASSASYAESAVESSAVGPSVSVSSAASTEAPASSEPIPGASSDVSSTSVVTSQSGSASPSTSPVSTTEAESEIASSTAPAASTSTTAVGEIVTSLDDFYTSLKNIIVGQITDPAQAAALSGLVDSIISAFTAALGNVAGPVFQFLFGASAKRALDIESYISVFSAFNDAIAAWEASPEYASFMGLVEQLSNYVDMSNVYSSFLDTFGATWDAAKATMVEYAAMDPKAAALSTTFLSSIDTLSTSVLVSSGLASAVSSLEATTSAPLESSAGESSTGESSTGESSTNESSTGKSSSVSAVVSSEASSVEASSSAGVSSSDEALSSSEASSSEASREISVGISESSSTAVSSISTTVPVTTSTSTEPCHACQTKTITSTYLTTSTVTSGTVVVTVTEPCETTYTVVESPLPTGGSATITVTEPCHVCQTKVVTLLGYTTITKTSGNVVVTVTEPCETTYQVVESPLPTGGFATVTVTEPCHECETKVITSSGYTTVTKTSGGVIVTVTEPCETTYITVVSPSAPFIKTSAIVVVTESGSTATVSSSSPASKTPERPATSNVSPPAAITKTVTSRGLSTITTILSSTVVTVTESHEITQTLVIVPHPSGGSETSTLPATGPAASSAKPSTPTVATNAAPGTPGAASSASSPAGTATSKSGTAPLEQVPATASSTLIEQTNAAALRSVSFCTALGASLLASLILFA